jgi:NTE family protein
MSLSADWIPFLRKVALFSDFREEDLAALLERMQMLSLPRGAVVFRLGEETDAMYLVHSGRLNLVEKHGAEDRVAAILTRGDALGEMGLLTGDIRAQTAVVESTAELLVLYKKDFEEVLAAHPHLAVPISRLLSARLVEAGRRKEKSGLAAKLYALVGPSSPEDRTILAVNLATALVEQTRRRVLLLDILESDTGVFTRALGLTPVKVNEHSLRQEDLLNPDMIRRLCTAHASGLELMSLPRSLMEGKFAGIIYSFLATLRKSHELILVALPGDLPSSARAVMEEADRVLVAERDVALAGDAPVKEAVSAAVEPDRRWSVKMNEGEPGILAPDIFHIPWKTSFTATRSPFLPPDAVHAQRSVDRLARKMGGVSIGLAMGSGAALGYVLIGFLKALERNGIFPDILAGTSMGALIGSFYAAGKTPAELEEIALSITKAKLWSLADLALPFPRQGLIFGGQVLRFLKSVLGEKNFGDLRLPFTCVATDIMNGEEVVLKHGKVAEAVRASLSLPFYFQPFFHQGRYLVDGGLVNPVPTSTIANMGADILIAVNTTMKPADKRMPGTSRRKARRPGFWKGPNLFDVLIKTIYTMQYGIAQTHKGPAHLILEPDVSAFTWADFHRASDIILAGETYIEPFIPKLKSFLPFFQDTCHVSIKKS